MSDGFPTSPEEMTLDWLASIVAGAERALTFDWSPIGGGYASRLVRITLSFRSGVIGPGSLIGKFALSTEAAASNLVGAHTYEREVSFYRRPGGDPGCRVPSVFAAEFDDATGEFALILEDFADAEPGRSDRGMLARTTRAGDRRGWLRSAGHWTDPRDHESRSPEPMPRA